MREEERVQARYMRTLGQEALKQNHEQETNSEFKFQHKKAKDHQSFSTPLLPHQRMIMRPFHVSQKQSLERSASSTLLASRIGPWPVLTRYLLCLRLIQEGRLITSLQLMWWSGSIPTAMKALAPSPMQMICLLYRRCPWRGPRAERDPKKQRATNQSFFDAWKMSWNNKLGH